MDKIIDSSKLSENIQKKEKFIAHIKEKYLISQEFFNDLPILNNYNISLIVDDSSSMVSNNSTKWDELCKTLFDCITIASPFINETDIHFLNTGSHYNVILKDISGLFKSRRPIPCTCSPLYNTLKKVFNRIIEKNKNKPNKKNLIIIGTDGEPNDASIKELNKMIINYNNILPNQFYIVFLIFSTDQAIISYLNGIDLNKSNIDVCDTYLNEKQQIYKSSGINISYGDYLVKCLLGAILDKYDKLDEKKNKVSHPDKYICQPQ